MIEQQTKDWMLLAASNLCRAVVLDDVKAARIALENINNTIESFLWELIRQDKESE